MDSSQNNSGRNIRTRSRLAKLVKTSVKLVFSTNTLFLAFSVATSLLTAWALGAEGRGELVIVTTWLFVFSLIGTLGLPFSHRYWSAKDPDSNSGIFSNTLLFVLVAGCFLFAIGWYLVPFILREQGPRVIFLTRLFLLNIPIILLSEMVRGQLEGSKLFGWLGAARLSFIAAQAITYLVFYVLGILNLINALLVIVGCQMLSVSMMVFAVVHNLRPTWRPDFSIFRKQFHYGIRSYTGILTEFAVLRLDQIMLTALVSSRLVGLYAIAVAVAEITATLASSVSDALMPEVAGSKDSKKSLLLMSRSLRLSVYAQLLALLPLLAVAPYVLKYVFGEEFVPAAGALRLLLFASVVWSSGLILISGLNGLGNPGLSSIARIASGVTTIVCLVFLLPLWGINGAAISSLLGYGVMTLTALICLTRIQKIGIWDFLRPRADDISIAEIRAAIRLPRWNAAKSARGAV